MTRRRIDVRIIEEMLRRQYPDACTKTAPLAFWKMRALIRSAEAFYLPKHDCYYIVRDKHLLYYSAPDDVCHLGADELNKLDAISLPTFVFNQIAHEISGFQVNEGWTLHYDFSYRSATRDFSAYEAVNFDFDDEAHYATAAAIIDAESGGWMTAHRVRRMTTFDAFDPSVWFFVRDKADGALVAVSISAYSPEVRETDLDWIFVRPDRHGKGAGRFLIQETIRRCEAKSDLIRVGGTVEFYRRCGFVDDTLWVWAVKPGYEFRCLRIQP